MSKTTSNNKNVNNKNTNNKHVNVYELFKDEPFKMIDNAPYNFSRYNSDSIQFNQRDDNMLIYIGQTEDYDKYPELAESRKRLIEKSKKSYVGFI